MTKQELIQVFIQNHKEAVDYVKGLSDQHLHYAVAGKWSPLQQLQHISLTIAPFSKVMASKEYMSEKFGSIDRPVWDCETVLEHYFETSLKAPVQYIPEGALKPGPKDEVIENLLQNLKMTGLLLQEYSEEELDTLVLPHPLLGKLTLREMFCLMGYHPLHHVKQMQDMLGKAGEI